MNLSRIIERWAEHFPSKVAIHFRGSDLSYAILWERIEEATRALGSRGIVRGDRVAFLGYNNPDMLLLLFALARLGAILVPLNWRLTVAEHRLIVQDCAPRLLFAEPEFAAHAAELGAPVCLILDGKWREGEATPDLAGRDDDDMLVMYTSGTTGRPKGAVLRQSALIWNGFNSIHAHDLSQRDHVLSPLPMFHVGGLNNQTLPALLAGATVTLQQRFEPGQWLTDVASRRPTVSLLVPAAMQAVLSHPNWDKTDLSSLKIINSGSMVVPESLIRAFHARGVPVGQIYGSTETAPIASILQKEDAMTMVGSAGKPALHCEIRISADDYGTEAPVGAVGEIWVRGPNVMRGYWNDPKATASVFHEEWFKTGDLARRDRGGFLWIAGRTKDVIISGGENIYPAEIENVLADCPSVAESTVIGIEDPRWGETACACIVRRPGAALDERGVLSLFHDRLARYKHPRRIVFVDELPKNAMGKVQKFELKRRLGVG